MKNIISASFEQVERSIDFEFSKGIYSNHKKFNSGFFLLYLIVFVGGLYVLYGVSHSVINNLDNIFLSLDINNEFKKILSNIWFVHLLAIGLFIGILKAFTIKKKNAVQGALILHTCIIIGYIVNSIYLFRLTELFISSPLLRLVYGILFIVCYLFAFIKSYQIMQKFVLNEEQQKSSFDRWTQKISVPKMIGILFALFIIFQIFKQTQTGQDYIAFETMITIMLVDIFPLFVCVLPFVCIYLFRSFIKMYYLNKHSEQFRLKFGVKKEEWFGEKYKHIA